jgi:hypothetical protein
MRQQIMPRKETISLPITCTDETCGMVSAFQFWRDGSFKLVMKACAHTKELPNRTKVLEAFAERDNSKGKGKANE